MPTITVKLDKKRAALLARWARRGKVPKSDVIRALIDRAGPIETEGAADQTAALASLQRFVLQGLHLAQAQRCALLQRRAARRMGENDAWLVATAQSLDADVAGADRAAFERLGDRYLRFR